MKTAGSPNDAQVEASPRAAAFGCLHGGGAIHRHRADGERVAPGLSSQVELLYALFQRSFRHDHPGVLALIKARFLEDSTDS